MARRKKRDPKKEQFWRTTLQEQRDSGLTVRQFCLQQDLTEANFYAWRREIHKRDQQTAIPSTSSDAKPNDQPTFLPIQVSPSNPDSHLELLLPDQTRIRVRGPIDEQALVAILSVLREES